MAGVDYLIIVPYKRYSYCLTSIFNGNWSTAPLIYILRSIWYLGKYLIIVPLRNPMSSGIPEPAALGRKKTTKHVLTERKEFILILSFYVNIRIFWPHFLGIFLWLWLLCLCRHIRTVSSILLADICLQPFSVHWKATLTMSSNAPII